MDEQVVRPEAELAAILESFVCVRVTDLAGHSLVRYRFDFDLTFAILFLSPTGRVYARYGSRDHTGPMARMSTVGLIAATQQVLAQHQVESHLPPRPLPRADYTPETILGVEDYWKSRQRTSCIHCHMIYDMERTADWKAGRWTNDRAYVYPLPENTGLSLAVDQGNIIEAIEPDSPADQAALQVGDRVIRLGQTSVFSEADYQWALQQAGSNQPLPITVLRNGVAHKASLLLTGPWRQTNISWRASLWALKPRPRLHAVPTSDGQAFEVRWVGEGPAKQAGLRVGDRLTSYQGQPIQQSWPEIQMDIRMNHQPGDSIRFGYVRNGEPGIAELVLGGE